MALDEERIQRILREYKDVFDALENYDKTGKLILKGNKENKEEEKEKTKN